MLPDTNIVNLIPQRPPFVMIDELLFADATRSRTQLKIRPENILVENGLFTEAGLVENMAQTAAAGAGYWARQQNREVDIGFITAVKNLIIHQLPAVGRELITEIIILDQVFTTTLITARVRCNGEEVADCEMSILLKPEPQP